MQKYLFQENMVCGPINQTTPIDFFKAEIFCKSSKVSLNNELFTPFPFSPPLALASYLTPLDASSSPLSLHQPVKGGEGLGYLFRYVQPAWFVLYSSS